MKPSDNMEKKPTFYNLSGLPVSKILFFINDTKQLKALSETATIFREANEKLKLLKPIRAYSVSSAIDVMKILGPFILSYNRTVSDTEVVEAFNNQENYPIFTTKEKAEKYATELCNYKYAIAEIEVQLPENAKLIPTSRFVKAEHYQVDRSAIKRKIGLEFSGKKISFPEEGKNCSIM